MSKFKNVNEKAKRWGKVSLAVGIIGVVGVIALTNKEIEVKANDVESVEEYELSSGYEMPLGVTINWDGVIKLNPDYYTAMIYYNNLFDDEPVVHNKSSEDFYIMVKGDAFAEPIVKDFLVPAYTEKKLPKIPYNSGRVTFSGKAVNRVMDYHITID